MAKTKQKIINEQRDEITRLKEALKKIVEIEKSNPWCFQYDLVAVAKQALKGE